MVSCIRRVGGQWLLSMISSDGWKSVKGRSDINRNTQGQREMTKATTRKEAFAEITDFVSQFGDNIVSIKTVSSSSSHFLASNENWLLLDIDPDQGQEDTESFFSLRFCGISSSSKQRTIPRRGRLHRNKVPRNNPPFPTLITTVLKHASYYIFNWTQIKTNAPQQGVRPRSRKFCAIIHNS